MLKRIVALILIAAASVAGYYYGYTVGFDASTQIFTNNPAPKKVEKKVDAGPSLENMLRAISGSWQSVADKKLVREFATSSAVTDTYANKRTFTGSVELFNIATVSGELPFEVERGRTYMAITDSKLIADETGEPTENVVYFRVDTITQKDLQLTPLPVSGQKPLIFKRI